MTNKAVKVTGTQVKELLAKVVEGIYLSKNNCYNAVTDFFPKRGLVLTDEGLKIEVDNVVTVNLPIEAEHQYINYAIGGVGTESDDPDLEEEWEDSTSFDYNFNLCGYTICFNTTDKGTELTWEQFKELTDSGNYGIFEVRNVDTCSVYINMDDCTIDVNDREIEINREGTNTIIDMDIIDSIYNNSNEYGDIYYRFEFNNGMSDMEIEVEYIRRAFQK